MFAALDELDWVRVIDELNEAGPPNQSVPEPILMTRNGTGTPD